MDSRQIADRPSLNRAARKPWQTPHVIVSDTVENTEVKGAPVAEAHGSSSASFKNVS